MNNGICHILFVCTGNLCRSPIAEGILKTMLAGEGIHHIIVKSAGMIASDGLPATRTAQAVSLNHGVDISTHLSRYVTADLVHEADVILVMEHAHKKEIKSWFHPYQNKVFLLKSFGSQGEDAEIDDPIGGNEEVFDFCFQMIEKEVLRIFPQLLELCGGQVHAAEKF